MTNKGSSNSTGSPFLAIMATMVPAVSASIWLNIFMASMMPSVSPTLTCWPTSTKGGDSGFADRSRCRPSASARHVRGGRSLLVAAGAALSEAIARAAAARCGSTWTWVTGACACVEKEPLGRRLRRTDSSPSWISSSARLDSSDIDQFFYLAQIHGKILGKTTMGFDQAACARRAMAASSASR